MPHNKIFPAIYDVIALAVNDYSILHGLDIGHYGQYWHSGRET